MQVKFIYFSVDNRETSTGAGAAYLFKVPFKVCDYKDTVAFQKPIAKCAVEATASALAGSLRSMGETDFSRYPSALMSGDAIILAEDASQVKVANPPVMNIVRWVIPWMRLSACGRPYKDTDY